jgi:hypothetical protein
LHSSIPGLSIVERVALARRLGHLGRILVAAAELGSGTLFNPVVPEHAAARLRDA